MNNFKDKKNALLAWMNAGNFIERCSEPGPSFGKFSGIDSCPISGVEPVINRLFREGKLKYKTFHTYGMRWEKYLPVTSEKISGEIHER